MDWTDRHDRYFLRLISRRARLYTEMVTADAIRFGDRARLLDFDMAEHPVALQLGGSDPMALAEAAEIGEGYGYDEINLNVGCPSDRVQSGLFGACLMRTPDVVADCVAHMREKVRITVSVKCRIGVDDQDPEEALFTLVEKVQQTGVRHFIVHARKAWLEGLSPKQNRDIPPLDYDIVHRLKQHFPNLVIVLNGGLTSLEMGLAHCRELDGVMLGRTAYKNPYILADVDRLFYGDDHIPPSREDVIEQLIPYAERMCAGGMPLQALARHILGLYQNRPNGRQFRRYLSENAPRAGADPGLLRDVLHFMRASQAA